MSGYPICFRDFMEEESDTLTALVYRNSTLGSWGGGWGANPIYKIGLRSGVLGGNFEKNP